MANPSKSQDLLTRAAIHHKHLGQPLAATMGATMPPSVDSHNHLGRHMGATMGPPPAPCEGANYLGQPLAAMMAASHNHLGQPTTVILG